MLTIYTIKGEIMMAEYVREIFPQYPFGTSWVWFNSLLLFESPKKRILTFPFRFLLSNIIEVVIRVDKRDHNAYLRILFPSLKTTSTSTRTPMGEMLTWMLRWIMLINILTKNIPEHHQNII